MTALDEAWEASRRMAKKERINVTVDGAIIKRYRESFPEVNVSEICSEALIVALCAMDTGQPMTLEFSYVEPKRPARELRFRAYATEEPTS